MKVKFKDAIHGRIIVTDLSKEGASLAHYRFKNIRHEKDRRPFSKYCIYAAFDDNGNGDWAYVSASTFRRIFKKAKRSLIPNVIADCVEFDGKKILHMERIVHWSMPSALTRIDLKIIKKELKTLPSWVKR